MVWLMVSASLKIYTARVTERRPKIMSCS